MIKRQASKKGLRLGSQSRFHPHCTTSWCASYAKIDGADLANMLDWKRTAFFRGSLKS